MSKLRTRPWIVHPHDPIEKLEPNLWCVTGDFPSPLKFRRRMGIARLQDGGLVFHNAVPLREEAMRELEAWGTPAVLVAPTGYHRVDLAPFKARYPALRVLCPASFVGRIAEVVAVDGDYSKFPRDPDVRVEMIEGSREGVLRVRSGGKDNLLFGDTIMEMQDPGGVAGVVLRLMGSLGGPKVTRVARLALMTDRRALRAHLERLAVEPGVHRLIPSHGPIRDDAPRWLREAAARL
jgi:hypothetical protein